jgi:4-aminobutyrate aminotransferase-like enzyme
MDAAEFGLKAARALEDKILELGADNVGAFIGEPVQGAGGVIIPPDTYWPEINRICQKYDVLLICDEVICGFGRTGNWFGLETFGIEPDLITMAKGLSSGYLPISAVGVSDRVADGINSEIRSSPTATPIRAIPSVAPSRCATSRSSSARAWSRRYATRPARIWRGGSRSSTITRWSARHGRSACSARWNW